ncbi:hypothetical protein LTR15_007845 [Elasticomyces elasticus]|nr:hypothetical protein LTR15_007845 [Elasticomyces elasticus]
MSRDSSSAPETCTDTVITQGSSASSLRFRTDAHRYGRLRRHKIISNSFAERDGKCEDSHTQRVVNTNRVEDYWKCKLAGSLPTALKPRLRTENGRRVGLSQQDKRRLPTKQWTKAFLRALEDLAYITKDDQACAHSRLMAEVKRRQMKLTHAEHYAREVLTSDIQAVAREFRRLQTAGHYPPKSLRRKGGSRIPRVDREASDITEEGEQQRDTSVKDTEELEMGGVTPPSGKKRKAESSASEHSIKRRKPFSVNGQSSRIPRDNRDASDITKLAHDREQESTRSSDCASVKGERRS